MSLEKLKFPAASAVLVLVLAAPLAAMAAGKGVHLEAAANDVANIASLQRGARNFVNYCMGCHSAQYVRYNRLAKDLQLSEDQVIDNLMRGRQVQRLPLARNSTRPCRWRCPPTMPRAGSARHRRT